MIKQIFSEYFSNDVINMFLDLIIDYCDDLMDFIGTIYVNYLTNNYRIKLN